MKNLIFAFAIVVLGCEKNIADHNEKLIENIIDEIRLGWENGDGTAFRSHFLDWDGARFFEGGGQNIGLEDLIVNHVEPEAELGLKLEFTNIQIHFEGVHQLSHNIRYH